MEFPKFIAAAVQAAPVPLDREATVAKACNLIHEAAANGAKLVVFPELFIPAYPYWSWLGNPFEGSPWFRRLYLEAVDVPGPATSALGEAAAAANAYVVIGVNERDPAVVGSLYNANLVFAPSGRLIGKHRKLVPTWAEKLTYTGGDGSSLITYPTEVGRLGTLCCGENTNSLARFALLAQGEQVHIANYPAFPFSEPYDMVDSVKLRSGALAFEGKLFCIVSTSSLTPEIVDLFGDTDAKRAALQRVPNAFSGIFGPDGNVIGEPVIDVEGISYGELDLMRTIEPRQMQNIAGGYNRFDVFQLHVNTASHRPVTRDPGTPPARSAGETGRHQARDNDSGWTAPGAMVLPSDETAL